MNIEKKHFQVFSDRKDLFFILLLLAVSLLSWYMHAIKAAAGAKAWQIVIFTDPVETVEIRKIPENPVKIQGKIGPASVEFNSAGQFRIASSTCPHGICVNYGWVSNGSVVCVPNGILVKTLENDEAIDAVSR
ncbi:MAG: NusG domain [Clostridiales bacterium]|jgi:hypothetical protein|nr:NusG domain [Clostridiales bacterium]MDN5282581.1 NusG domain [Candidatus Ozemobacter sp.]